ncbi:ABC transporter ATP-binding protein [Streptomyces sp. NPDC049687]|uniref:ABC transporter ATP-binding protein n=1 Tax=Streptomyces sp. NPDC049687 TaxID=3365596 RepID=UPI0037A36E96
MSHPHPGRPRNAPVALLLRAAARTDPHGLTLLVGAVAVAACVPAALALTSGALVARLADGATGTTVAVPVGLLGLLFFLLQSLTPVAVALAEHTGRRLDRAVSDRVMAALQRPASLARVEEPGVRDLLATVDARRAEASLLDAVVGATELAVLRLGAVAGALLLTGYRWWLALLLIAAYGTTMVVVSRTYQRSLTASERAPEGLRRARYLQELVVRPTAAKDVRLFGLGDWLTGLYRAERERAAHRLRGARGGGVRADLLTGAAALAAQGLTFVLLALDVRDHRISPGQFTTYAVAATGILALHLRGPGLLSIARAGETLRAVTALERHLGTGRDATATPAEPLRLNHTITCEGVGFRYPGSDRWVLRGLDLVIPAGSSTALVGANGAGKTTLVKLLTGLYEPTEGRILVDGTDLRELGVRRWQPRCAALFQDWLRWGLPLRDNVLLGAVDAPADPPGFDRAVAGAGLAEVAAGLPEGWDTVLGREFDGTDLSGGQWQRVALARALWALHCGAQLLILDEPTSALDVRGEAGLYDTLLTAAADSTVLIVSHRFSTVRRADRIVVLVDGTVAESGSHCELMARGGAYARMFTVQSDRFTKDRTGEESHP